MHKVFISYHHANDQAFKEALLEQIGHHHFIDASVDTGDISDDLDDQAIREKIRDDYLADSSVTLLLVGTGTKNRKHVDWSFTPAWLTERGTRVRHSGCNSTKYGVHILPRCSWRRREKSCIETSS
jgi:hypothetical protein